MIENANTPTSLVAPFDFDRLVLAVERCAAALETLASDVKPPASKPMETIRVGVSEKGFVAQHLAEQAAKDKASGGQFTSSAPAGVVGAPLAAASQVVYAATGQPVSASRFADPSVGSWADEAAALEKTFAECEAAKRVLGDDLYHAVWATPLLDRVELSAAVGLRDRAITVLGSREAFERARDASGAASGKLPTGEQARRIVLEHVVPAAEKGGAE